MAGIKKVPMRQCVGCRTMFEKRSLMRIVKGPDGEIELDLTGKKPGRGTYICKNAECIKKAKKSKALQRAFGCELSDELFCKMQTELEELSVNG